MESVARRAISALTRDRLTMYPVALLLATLAVYALGASRASHGVLPNGRVIGEDFLAFFMAGDMALHGQVDRLYDAGAQTDYQNRFMADINPGWTGVCLYLNPPHYARAMALFSWVGYGGALALWCLASLLAFAGAAWIWARWLPRESRRLTLLLAVCAPPFFQALAGGQNSFFSLLILTGFCALLLKRREATAGLVLSLLGYKFQLMIAPVLVLLFLRRWRALAACALGGLLTLAFVVAVDGPDVLFAYVAFGRSLPELMQLDGFDFFKQHSWYGFFELLGQGWLPTSAVRALAMIASVVTLAGVVRVFRGGWRPEAPLFALQLSALTAATLIVSPHLFHYDLLLALLPVMLWLKAAGELRDFPERDAMKLLTAFAFVWFALAAPLAPALHLQLTPVLCSAWIYCVGRRCGVWNWSLTGRQAEPSPRPI